MASQQDAGAQQTSRSVRAYGRSGRHGRPSAVRAAIQARLEELEFRRGIALMVTAAGVFIVAVIGIALALLGGNGGKEPSAGGPPAEDTSSANRPAPSVTPSDAVSPAPRSGRRPNTSSSTMVGEPAPQPTVRPTVSPTTGQPSWWPGYDPRFRRWHHSPPPWWRHH